MAVVLPLVLLAGALASAAAVAAPASFAWSSSRLFTPPLAVPDVGPPLGFSDVACTASSLCVAVSHDGHAFASSAPAGGPAAWTGAVIDPDGAPQAVSCPSQTLCVVVDDVGRVLTSTSPGAQQPSWSSRTVSSDLLRAVSCATASSCVAVDDAGRVLTSTDPTGGAGAWSAAMVDAAGAPLLAVACPSDSLCVALDAFGDVLTSHAPMGGPQAWSVEPLPGPGAAPVVLSCPSTSLCLALDDDGNAYASNAPADGAATWRAVGNVGLALPAKLSCPSDDRCLAVDGGHGLAVSDLPAGGSEEWSTSALDGTLLLSGVACPAVTRCVLADRGGQVLVGDAPAPAGSVDVTLFGEGDGTIAAPGLSCATTCGGSYPRGSRIVLTAIPSPGSAFAGWGGACVGSALCEVTVGAATTITAGFVLAPPPPGFRLSISIGGMGSVSGPGIACPERCVTTRPPGATDALTATPAAGWRFSGWGGGCGKRPRCLLTARADQALIALFEPGPAPPMAAATVRIRAPRISPHGTVRLRFASSPAGASLRCALVRRGSVADAAMPRFARCRSPKIYAHLRAGRYVFLVRIGRATAVVARRPFTLP